jgi:hypothetical protein
MYPEPVHINGEFRVGLSASTGRHFSTNHLFATTALITCQLSSASTVPRWHLATRLRATAAAWLYCDGLSRLHEFAAQWALHALIARPEAGKRADPYRLHLVERITVRVDALRAEVHSRMILPGSFHLVRLADIQLEVPVGLETSQCWKPRQILATALTCFV